MRVETPANQRQKRRDVPRTAGRWPAQFWFRDPRHPDLAKESPRQCAQVIRSYARGEAMRRLMDLASVGVDGGST